MDAAPETEQFLGGGLGKYRVTPSQGPFIHVDTRLYRARWQPAPEAREPSRPGQPPPSTAGRSVVPSAPP